MEKDIHDQDENIAMPLIPPYQIKEMFNPLNDDQEELDELEERIKHPDIIVAAAKAQMETCYECHGAKVMSYLITKPAPWYARMLGSYGIRVWFMSRGSHEWQRDIPCKRCKGTGREVIHIDAATATPPKMG